MIRSIIKSKFSLAVVTVALVMPAITHADTIRLKDGRELEGEVEDNGATIKLKTELGAITINRGDIAKWSKGSGSTYSSSSKALEFERLEKLLGSGTAEERYRLGTWARSNKLRSKANKAFESVLLLDPDHVGARTALGYKNLNGTWLVERDYYKLKGMVKFRGQWMSPIERSKLLTARKTDKKIKQLERELKALKKAVKRQSQRDRQRQARQRPDTPYDIRLGIQPTNNFYGPGFQNQSVFNSYYGGYFYGYPWNINRQFNGVLPWRPIIINNPIIGQGSSRQQVLPYGGLNSHPSYYGYPFSSNYYRRSQQYGSGFSFDWSSKSGRTRVSGSFGAIGRRNAGQVRGARGRSRTSGISRSGRRSNSGRANLGRTNGGRIVNPARSSGSTTTRRNSAHLQRLINGASNNRSRQTRPRSNPSASQRNSGGLLRLIDKSRP